jgi:hypothetical protein
MSWLLLLLELLWLLRSTMNSAEFLCLVLVSRETKLAFPGVDNGIADCCKAHSIHVVGSKFDHGLHGVVGG